MPRSSAAYLADIVDESVYAIAGLDMPVLRRECAMLLERTGEAD